MSEMVERVARALKAYAASVDLKSGANPSLEMARAAIEAMREPSEAMIESFDAAYSLGNPNDSLSSYSIKDGWNRAIDEALK